MSLEERLNQLLNQDSKQPSYESNPLLLHSYASPLFNIHWVDHSQRGFLHLSCLFNQYDLVSQLLTHPRRVNPNQRDHFGWTPFILACDRDAVEIVELLLNDPRVDVNCRSDAGNTGLTWACWNGHVKVVEQILASLRYVAKADITLAMNKAKNGYNVEKASDFPLIQDLLQDYQNEPFNTVRQLRIKLNLQEYGPVSVFVLIVLLCDDYLGLIRVEGEKYRQLTQFFEIMMKLPMDLQMVVCNRSSILSAFLIIS